MIVDGDSYGHKNAPDGAEYKFRAMIHTKTALELVAGLRPSQHTDKPTNPYGTRISFRKGANAFADKPFCDNSPVKAGFTDSGAVGQSGPGSTSEAGELTIKPVTDGPLLTRGKLTIFASTGRVAWEGEKTALCRCGASQNKPFCDGSHKAAGFKAE